MTYLAILSFLAVLGGGQIFVATGQAASTAVTASFGIIGLLVTLATRGSLSYRPGLAEGDASSGEVRELAGRIRAAQGPEIDQMRGWLQAWGEPAPEDSEMGGMDHDGMEMGGLDQQAAMDELGRWMARRSTRRFSP